MWGGLLLLLHHKSYCTEPLLVYADEHYTLRRPQLCRQKLFCTQLKLNWTQDSPSQITCLLIFYSVISLSLKVLTTETIINNILFHFIIEELCCTPLLILAFSDGHSTPPLAAIAPKIKPQITSEGTASDTGEPLLDHFAQQLSTSLTTTFNFCGSLARNEYQQQYF